MNGIARKSWVPYFQLALALIIVGSSVVAGKLMVATLPVMLSSCARFAISTPILLLMLWLREGLPKTPSPKDLGILFLQALTGVFLFSVFLLFGLQRANGVDAGLITGTLPAVTAILAVLMLKDKLNKLQILGITCAAIGAMFLNIMGVESTNNSSTFLGLSLVFAAVVCEALFTVLGKQMGKSLSALAIATTMSVLGFLLFLPFAIWDALDFDFSAITLQDILLVVYFGTVVTVGAFWLFYAGLAKIPASVASGFMAILPLSAVILSALILEESISFFDMMAGLFVIVGIVLVAKNGKKTVVKP